MDKIISALQQFVSLVEGKNIFWILSGSVSLALQWVDVVPKEDIDILTDATWAKALDELLADFVVKKSEYSSTDKYKSYFGIYKIDDIQVEVMGDFQYMTKEGIWSKENQTHEIIYKEYHGMQLPMLTLEQELQEYENMGRTDKAEKIRLCLQSN